MADPRWKENLQWITDERLAKINVIRVRNGLDALTREELESWLVSMNEKDMKQLREAIASTVSR